MPQLLTLKTAHLKPMLLNQRSHHIEKPATVTGEWPRLASTRESPYAAAKAQLSQIKKLIKNFKKQIDI